MKALVTITAVLFAIGCVIASMVLGAVLCFLISFIVCNLFNFFVGYELFNLTSVAIISLILFLASQFLKRR